ncbi:MAG: TIGR04211 family SH3 domain-containing protein [Pseudomonadota bacterium]
MTTSIRAHVAGMVAGMIALLFAGVAPGETGYIIDQLLAGMHRDRTLDSPIIKVLPSGSKLEVLTKGEDFTQVRTEDGTLGWVDSSYVMNEKPARIRLVELEQERDSLNRALDEARSELVAVRANPDPSASPPTVRQEVYDRLLEERDALLKEVGNYADRVRTLTAEGDSSQNPPTGTPDVTAAQLTGLQTRITTLSQKLEEQHRAREAAEAALANTKAEVSKLMDAHTPTKSGVTDTRPVRHHSYREWLTVLSPWQIALIGFSLLLAFSVGGYWIDFLLRRRHGGFRI